MDIENLYFIEVPPKKEDRLYGSQNEISENKIKKVYLNNLFLKETFEDLKVSDIFEEKYIVYEVVETDLKIKKYLVKELIYFG